MDKSIFQNRLALISSIVLGITSSALAGNTTLVHGVPFVRTLPVNRVAMQTQAQGQLTGFSVKSSLSIQDFFTVKTNAAPAFGDLSQVQSKLSSAVHDRLVPFLHRASQGALAAAADPSNTKELSTELFAALGSLSEVAKSISISQHELEVDLNFVVFPNITVPGQTDGPTPNADADFDEKAFSTYAAYKMEQLQVMKYGSVETGHMPLVPLAAAVSVHFHQGTGEVRAQLVSLVNPQDIPGDNPIKIPSVLNPMDASIMFFDVTQPFAAVLPTATIEFGKLGNLGQEGWQERFAVSGHEALCSRTYSTPLIWNKQQGIWLPISLYKMNLDFNKKEKIVDSDVRLSVLGTCSTVFGMVPEQFMPKANAKFDDATAVITRLFGASPPQLLAMLEAKIKPADIPTESEGD